MLRINSRDGGKERGRLVQKLRYLRTLCANGPGGSVIGFPVLVAIDPRFIPFASNSR